MGQKVILLDNLISLLLLFDSLALIITITTSFETPSQYLKCEFN